MKEHVSNTKEDKKKSLKVSIKKLPSLFKVGKDDVKLLVNILICLVIPFLFFIGMEFLQRGNIGVKNFIDNYKNTALLNYTLLLIFISPAILFKRTHFAASIFALPWAVLSAVSAMITKFRGVPFIWSDIYSAGEGLSIANQYVSKAIIVKVCIAAISILLVLIICFFIRFKEYKVNFVKRIAVLVLMLIGALFEKDYLIKHGAIEKSGWDMAVTYERNGFMYSFIDSYLSTVKKETDNYSSGAIGEIAETIRENEQEKLDGEQPNIILVQVEALCDPTIIEGVQFNEDPIPNFRKYFNEGYSGQLQVPTIGGGTARTEFEVLAGVNLDYLSPGEIPYNSGLTSKEPIETIAYILKEKNYQTTAIHNFEGNFYSRDKAFENLGFDRFIPMESMLNLVKHRPFPEDHVLLDYIDRTINLTEKRDFVFTITVGTHGPYNTTLNKGNQKYVSGDLKESTLYQLQNYVSLIKRTDKFIGELAEYVYALEEPTVLIVYSDHYPKLEAIDSLTEKQKFNTPYFMIDNQHKLPKSKDNDIEAYQLSTSIFNLSQLQGGVMNVFHNAYRGKENYQTELELIQYDMLFGEKYCMDNKNPYTPTVIQIGLEKLEINKVEYSENNIIIKGIGFTKSSKIFLGNKLLETKFVNENELIGEGIKTTGDSVQVKLLGRNNAPILSSNSYIIHE